MAATTPTNGGSYANTYAVNAAGRVHKLAETIIHKVDAVNPLAFMMRPELKTGDTIEENIIALVNRTAFNGTHTDKPYTAADVKTKYFRSWNKSQYRASVNYGELAEVSENDAQVNEIMETVVSTLTASEGNDDFEDCKALLKKFGDSWATSAQKLTATGEADLIKKIRGTVKRMGFLSNPYVAATGVKNRAEVGKIHIVLPIDVSDDLSVQFWAQVQNKGDAALIATYHEIDTTDNRIYIMDERTFSLWSKNRHMTPYAYDDSSDTYNFNLHSERMATYSDMLPAAMITYTPAASASSIANALAGNY